MWPSVAGLGVAVMPNMVSEVPSEIAMSPASASPSPASEHGLSPDHASTAQPASKPYLKPPHNACRRAGRRTHRNGEVGPVPI